MPNWCKGEIRIRGSRENVKRFLLEGLEECVPSINGATKQMEKDEYDIVQCDCAHIRNTHRGFIDDLYQDLNFYDWDDVVYIACEVRFAWDCDAEKIQEIAKDFNIDIRMYLFEAGLEFNRDIEVINGIITKNNTIKYDNYFWECIMPNLGG